MVRRKVEVERFGVVYEEERIRELMLCSVSSFWKDDMAPHHGFVL